MCITVSGMKIEWFWVFFLICDYLKSFNRNDKLKSISQTPKVVPIERWISRIYMPKEKKMFIQVKMQRNWKMKFKLASFCVCIIDSAWSRWKREISVSRPRRIGIIWIFVVGSRIKLKVFDLGLWVTFLVHRDEIVCHVVLYKQAMITTSN